MEIWKDIPEFEGLYQASDQGQIKSLQRVHHRMQHGKIHPFNVNEKILTVRIEPQGYRVVTLWKDKVIHVVRVHRLIALTFLPNPVNKKDVNHKNGIKSDNRVTNLEWATRQENIIHSYVNGLSRQNKLGDSDPRRKAVLQFDLKGNFIKEYSGRHEAARQTGLIQSGISACCTGRVKQFAGFKWASK